MAEWVIDSMGIAYTERQNCRAKRIVLSVRQDRIVVTYPPGTSKKRLRDFVVDNRAWIVEQVRSCRRQAENYRREWVDGTRLPFCGQDLILRIIKYNKKMIEIKRIEDVLWVFLPEAVDEESITDNVRNGVLHWYKNQARQIFAEKLTNYAQEMKVTFGQFRVKEQRTRWGSCSANKNINLNWKLIMAPEPVIDYLVVHELSHLSQLNHSKEFWQLVKRYCPDFYACRNWLRRYGKTLEL